MSVEPVPFIAFLVPVLASVLFLLMALSYRQIAKDAHDSRVFWETRHDEVVRQIQNIRRGKGN